MVRVFPSDLKTFTIPSMVANVPFSKFQSLMINHENQIPKTLLTIELVAAPLACMFGASFQFETNESQGDGNSNEGLERAFDSENELRSNDQFN